MLIYTQKLCELRSHIIIQTRSSIIMKIEDNGNVLSNIRKKEILLTNSK